MADQVTTDILYVHRPTGYCMSNTSERRCPLCQCKVVKFIGPSREALTCTRCHSWFEQFKRAEFVGYAEERMACDMACAPVDEYEETRSRAKLWDQHCAITAAGLPSVESIAVFVPVAEYNEMRRKAELWDRSRILDDE